MSKFLKLFVILVSIASLLLTTGCANSGSVDETSESKDNDAIQIGMCFDSFVIERWERDRDVFVSTAKKLGAEVNIQNANGDVEKQISQIEYFINKKMDVIVIVAIDGDSLTSVVKKARDAGIEVIAYDRLIKNADISMYISFDNEAVGTMMGEAIASDENVSNVLMICGSKSDNNVSLVENGFLNVMQEKEINVIDKTYCDGWKADLAYDYVNDNVELLDEADAIMCGNDDIATNVIRALSVNRRAGEIAIVGQDADLAACQHIVEKTQKMTVYKPVEKLANEAARYAVSLGEKKPLSVNLKINNGSYDIPYVALQPVSVDINNIDSVIIDGGFHIKEDVYLHISK